MKNKGFSLVELSVSIVIIALLLTGVMKGTSLVAEAKLRAVISEVTQNRISISSFYNKYGKYPGDFNEAASATTGNWGATTKDGDGDDRIEFVNTLATPVYEGYVAWQHLAYAGMVNSPYPGTVTTAAAAPGGDVPASKIGGGYLLDYGLYGMTNKNIMLLGVPATPTGSNAGAAGVMMPTQAMGIDAKMDDGNPASGSVRGADGKGAVAGNCISAIAPIIYKLTLSGKDCVMAFKAAG